MLVPTARNLLLARQQNICNGPPRPSTPGTAAPTFTQAAVKAVHATQKTQSKVVQSISRAASKLSLVSLVNQLRSSMADDGDPETHELLQLSHPLLPPDLDSAILPFESSDLLSADICTVFAGRTPALPLKHAYGLHTPESSTSKDKESSFDSSGSTSTNQNSPLPTSLYQTGNNVRWSSQCFTPVHHPMPLINAKVLSPEWQVYLNVMLRTELPWTRQDSDSAQQWQSAPTAFQCPSADGPMTLLLAARQLDSSNSPPPYPRVQGMWFDKKLALTPCRVRIELQTSPSSRNATGMAITTLEMLDPTMGEVVEGLRRFSKHLKALDLVRRVVTSSAFAVPKYSPRPEDMTKKQVGTFVEDGAAAVMLTPIEEECPPSFGGGLGGRDEERTPTQVRYQAS